MDTVKPYMRFFKIIFGAILGYLISSKLLLGTIDGLSWGTIRPENDQLMKNLLALMFFLGFLVSSMKEIRNFTFTKSYYPLGIAIGALVGLLVTLDETFVTSGTIILLTFFIVVASAGYGVGILVGKIMKPFVDKIVQKYTSHNKNTTT